MNFGKVTSSGAKATSYITVRCSKGTKVTITLNGGEHAERNVLNRRMLHKDNQNGNYFIRYQLYKNNSYDKADIWGNGKQRNGKTIKCTSGRQESLPVYGKITSSTGHLARLPAGEYRDTITASLKINN
jgi:spore coat protein U-like protein